MTKPVHQTVPLADNDVAGLFSHFGAFSKGAEYKEFVLEDAAANAARRWPLLAEIEEIDRQDDHAAGVP